MHSIALLIVGFVGFLCLQALYNQYFHPLGKFPGPFCAKHTDVWRAYHLCTRRFPDTLSSLHAKHGPVIRIGPNDLSFQSVDAIEAIYKSGRRVSKSSFYDGFTTFHPNLFGTRDEELHALRRRQMAHSFSAASLSKMEHIFDCHIKKLLDAMDAFGDRPFDLKELIAYYTYDIMGELIFNADFGSQDAQDPAHLPPINNHIWLGCLYGMLPSLLPYSMHLSPWIPLPWLQDKLKSRRALREKTAIYVTAELEKGRAVERHNILNRLLHAKDPDTGEGLTTDQISSEAFAFLVAGSHTTSGSLTLLFYHILHNPTAAQRLTEELAQHPDFRDRRSEDIFAFAGLEQQLPYANACIRESFRVSPVFTMPLPRAVMEPDGMIVAGHHVPHMANVSVVNQVVHHDPMSWGGDHDLFRPERWLDPSKPLVQNNLLPFGAGHRACIGRNIAMMSIVKVLVTVWAKYDIQAVELQEHLVVESVGIGGKEGPLMVTAKIRRHG